MNKEEQQAALLEQYNAALRLDKAARPPADLDPTSASLLHQLRGEMRGAKPNSAFHDRLRQQIDTLAMPEQANPIALSRGRMEHTTMQASNPSTARSPFSRPLIRFAATALALMVITTSAMLFSGVLRHSDNPAVTQPTQPVTCSGPLGSWHNVAPLPQPLALAAAASDDRYLYVVGGVNDGVSNKASNQLLRYDSASNTWSTLTPAPDSFASASAVYAPLNHKVYVFGGVVGQGVESNLTRIYDPTTNTWSAGATMPQPRVGMASAYWNGRIYLVSGGDGANYDPQNQTWAYNPIANTWDTTLASLPLKSSGAHGGAINGHLYVAGGLGDAQRTAVTYDYDIATNIWKVRANLPQPVQDGGSAVVGNRFYIFGGANSAGDGIPTTYVYDPTSDSWVTGATMSQARVLDFGMSIGNTIYGGGGYYQQTMFSGMEAATISCASK